MKKDKGKTTVMIGEETRYSFETPPAPIPDSEIIETIETEAVVIGAGTAGLVCANSAVENGAKVILISASSYPISRGGSNHAINTKLTRKLGINYDVGKNFKQEMDRAGGRIDQGKWYLFARKSGEAMDWLIDKMIAAGYTPVLEMEEVDPDGLISSFPGSHCFIGANVGKNLNKIAQGQPYVVKTLAKLAQAAGVKIYYNTIAKQLIRENNNTGRVTAVIAKNSDGKYIKYVGSKAIVLATGDFTRDREMVSKYCPEVLPLVNTAPVNYNTQYPHSSGGVYAGDGHKMGLWVGAAWQQTVPNAPMISSRSFKGLVVNKNGVRYCNEDVTRAQAGLIQMRQPDWKIFEIWSSDYADRMAALHPMGSYYSGPEQSVEDIVARWEAGNSGQPGWTLVKADTIEELAERLGLNATTLKATVDRYNGFCETGVDEEFFKRAGYLIPVKVCPFYGLSSSSPRLLIVCGGLRTNLKMQVLDTKGEVIPGLYTVGTIVGDMFANYYSFMPAGINYGATCVTFGYLTGKEIASS